MTFQHFIQLLEVAAVPVAVALIPALLGGNIAAKYFEDKRLRKEKKDLEYKDAARKCQKIIADWRSRVDRIFVLSVAFLGGRIDYCEFFEERAKIFSESKISKSDISADLFNYFPEAAKQFDRCVEAISAVSNMVYRHKEVIGDLGIDKSPEYDQLSLRSEELTKACDELQMKIGASLRNAL